MNMPPTVFQIKKGVYLPIRYLHLSFQFSNTDNGVLSLVRRSKTASDFQLIY